MQLINNDDNLNSEFLKRFIEIAQDDNQLISVLKDKQIINKKVLKLSDMQQEYEYSNLLNLKKIDDKEYIISFTWHNSKEASEILKKVINLTLSNLKLSFFNELETLLNEKKKKIRL